MADDGRRIGFFCRVVGAAIAVDLIEMPEGQDPAAPFRAPVGRLFLICVTSF